MTKINENTITTIGVTVDIAEEDIFKIVWLGLYSLEKTWAAINDTTKDWENKPKDIPGAVWVTKLLMEGKEVDLFDANKNDEELLDSLNNQDIEDQGFWKLTLDKIIHGIELASNSCKSIVIHKDWSKAECNFILQHALFERVVFDY